MYQVRLPSHQVRLPPHQARLPPATPRTPRIKLGCPCIKLTDSCLHIKFDCPHIKFGCPPYQGSTDYALALPYGTRDRSSFGCALDADTPAAARSASARCESPHAAAAELLRLAVILCQQIRGRDVSIPSSHVPTCSVNGELAPILLLAVD